MKMSRKHIYFFSAVALLIISVIYRLMNPYVQPRVDQLTHTGGWKKIIRKVDHGKPCQNLVNKFLNRPKISDKVYTDLFALYKPPAQAEDKIIAIEKNNDPEISISSQVPVPKNRAAEIKEKVTAYRIYGSYKSQGKKAVFLGKDKQVLVARTGDMLEGKYRIDEIRDNSIRIKALDFNEPIDIHIQEFNDD